ncbi:related to VCX1 - Vacuolar Ca++/H+ exchanger [Ustilago trichophora]|uniref:Vacuolar calcium ion transporter n=1 Tax=Ustilago trichophora TaxID=86804 RepID=A0A5C3E7T9_9BASI|nr:related to VCX1 - Vacuolar Ca++/H+ exchanger [Ustilago trichophora]
MSSTQQSSPADPSPSSDAAASAVLPAADQPSTFTTSNSHLTILTTRRPIQHHPASQARTIVSQPDMLEKGQAGSSNEDSSALSRTISSSDPASSTTKRGVDRDHRPFAMGSVGLLPSQKHSFRFLPQHPLVFIPVSWALHFALDQTKVTNGIVTFVTSFLAIMPLATMLSQATEELSLRVGETIGGLINASLGNAVELIVAIVSLFKCELIITQTSLLGSILSNLLLVLGTCFFAGGLRVKEQVFLSAPAQLNTSLLMMAVISLRGDILKFSRGVSVLLLLIYIGFLFFSLRSHKEFFEDDNDDEEEEQPQMNMVAVIISLVVVTVLVGVTSEWLVDSINVVVSTGGISRTWIGLILLPIASNATEHLAAVIFAWKNKIQMASSIAIGSSIQIALFVIPLLVIIAWIGDKPLTLLFDPFATILLFLTVLIVNFAIADNRSNYLEGFVLIMVYLIVALTVWFVPDNLADALFSDEYCNAR